MQDAQSSSTYEQFASQLLPSLRRFALSLTGDQADAEDLVQDGLVRLAVVWSRISRGDIDLVPYAYKILVNLNLNRLRSLRRQRKAEARLLGDSQLAATVCDSRGAITLWEPWLESAFRELPRMQRTCIALVHIWDYSVDDAATICGCMPNTVRTHLNRGLTRLREADRLRQPAGAVTSTQGGRKQ